MPLKTFENLNEERREEIIDTCLEEFSLYDYREASLTRIIKRLGLAKGSFYRYFSSKKELYAYLIEYGKRATFELFKEIFHHPVKDILEAWVSFYLVCAEQDNAHPLIGYFGYKVSREKNNPILKDVPLASKKKGLAELRDLFEEQQAKGRLRKDVDADLLIFILLQVQEGFIDYLALKYNIDFEENIRKKKPLFPLRREVLKRELEAFAMILREGFLKGMFKGEKNAE